MFTGTCPVPADEYKCAYGTLLSGQKTTSPVCPHRPPCLRQPLCCSSCICQANRSISFRESCCFCLLSHRRSAGLTRARSHSLLRVGSRCFNTASHSCTASTALYPVSHLPGSITQCSSISNPQRFLAICMAECVFDLCSNEQRPSGH